MFSVATCPEGWVRRENFCYLYDKNGIEKKSWQAAVIECQKKGGNLASIHDEEENIFISSKFILISVFLHTFNELLL